MQNKERLIIATTLFFITLIISLDLFSDMGQGAQWWHLALESSIAIFSIFGIFLLIKGSFTLNKKLEIANNEIINQKNAAENWRNKAQNHIEGLSRAINEQFLEWQLTPSEKEIAMLLLKGLSLKEISSIRGTNEKTVRGQATIIYQKSGLSGRADLSAFFLEDLLR